MLQWLAFEPITGAIGLYVLEKACRSRPSRFIPHARYMFRRVSEVLTDTAVNEAAEPLLDGVVNAADLYFLATLIVALVLWRHREILRSALFRRTGK